MTVTDPDVPDPLNDPRTLQADPGAYGEGADLASTEDDPAATGDEELVAEREMAHERTKAEMTDHAARSGGFPEAPPS